MNRTDILDLACLDEEIDGAQAIEEALTDWSEAEPEARALAIHLECWVDEIDNVGCAMYECGRRTYMVLDDDDADAAQDEYLNDYINEFVLPEIPEAYQDYFDEDRFIEDAKTDGRGHALNRYDGSEHSETDPDTGVEYFIYQQ